MKEDVVSYDDAATASGKRRLLSPSRCISIFASNKNTNAKTKGGGYVEKGRRRPFFSHRVSAVASPQHQHQQK